MSTKQTVLEREPQAAVFYDLFHDPEICSHCFVQIRDVDAVDRENWGSRLATAPEEHRTLTENAVMGYDTRAVDCYGELEADHPQAYCADCGRTSAPATDIYAMSELMDAAGNIETSLRERGHVLDIDVLRDSIRAAKSKRDLQGHDTEILAWATGRALRLASPAPDAAADAHA